MGPYYVAYTGNIEDRDALGYGGVRYTDRTGNNDIKGAKLARDKDNLYVYIECNNDISPYTDPNWMNVYLDTVNGGLDGWESFDYVIKDATADTVSLYKFKGTGYDNDKVADCAYKVTGSVMQIKVKRADLGIPDGDFTVNFKVTDGVVLDGDILNFYTSGDVAPAGRFKYSYVAKAGEIDDNTSVVTGENTSVVTDGNTAAATDEDTKDTQTTGTETDRKTKTNSYTGILIGAVAAAAVAVAAVIAVIVIKKKK